MSQEVNTNTKNSQIDLPEGELLYGICYQSIVPIRATSAHRSEMISQLLFGEHYTVIATNEDKTWLLIENAFDKYRGWIDANQHKAVEKEYFNVLSSMRWPINKDLVGLVHGQNKVIPIVYGAVLPVFNNGVMIIDKEPFKYAGEVFYPVTSNQYEFMYSVARFYLAAPYLWGGRTPFGIDCSGFVQQVFRVCGYCLPRDAYQQAEVGRKVQFQDIIPGDVAFFQNAQGRVTHVGIVCENNRILHASGEVRIDKLTKDGILNYDKKIQTHKLHSIRRILE